MDFGWTSLCLPTQDLQRARRFYEALGMEVVDAVPDLRIVLRNGPFRLALMPFLTEPLLNWRGGDAFEVHAAVTRAFPDAPGEPRAYQAHTPGFEADADGTCWSTRDPDGHEILIDTNALETDESGRAARVGRILLDAERALACAGASPECLASLRTAVIEPFVDLAAMQRA